MQPNSNKDTKDCVVVLVTNGLGGVLFGRRRDDNKFTLIAGHVKENEDPQAAAIREVWEEAGLKATFLTPIRVEEKDGTKIHFYSTQITQGEPTVNNDPDKESSKIMWVDVRNGIPSNIWNRLAGPKGDANIIRQIYDLKKNEELEWFDSVGLFKSEQIKDEVGSLLTHGNFLERCLALKLSSVTPSHLALSILDPHPVVFQTAFNHPDSHYALHTLASNTRDASGKPIFDRHDLLIKDKRLSPEHLNLMAQAIKNDSFLPVNIQAQQLAKLASFDLKKHEFLWAHPMMYASSTSAQDNQGKVVDVSHEETPEHHKSIKQAYEEGVNSTNAVAPQNAGLHDMGLSSPKAVYHIGNHKFMVKPYEEEDYPLSGWAESASQKLFHAAGLGHLHQKSFVSTHGAGKYKIPASVIKLEPDAVPVHKAPLQEYRKLNPGLNDEARKIAIMDYVTGNLDRYAHNLMIRPDGHLLAIDHANNFQGAEGVDFSPDYTAKMTGIKTIVDPTDKDPYNKLMKEWWPQVAGRVKQAFYTKLNGIKSNSLKNNIKEGFDKRVAHLDSRSEEPLNKTLEGSAFIHKQHDTHNLSVVPDLTGVHSKLKMATPDAVKPLRQHFELNLNQHQSSHKPILTYDPSVNKTMGEEPKSIYQHGENKFLIKPQVAPSTSMSAFNELTSQAMYHAGGIGHLHQKVHATTFANHPQTEAGKEPNAIAVHLEKGVKQANEAEKDDDPRMQKMLSNPEHLRSLRKMGVMDWLTGNQDRHSGNIMIHEDGSPIAIDHGRALSHDREYALGMENQNLYRDDDLNEQHKNWISEFQKDPKKQLDYFDNFGGKYSDADIYSGGPDEDTWKWWDQNKDNMRNAYIKHVNMLPNKQMRDRMLESFDVRFNHLNEYRQHGGKAMYNSPVPIGLKPTEVSSVARTLPANVTQDPARTTPAKKVTMATNVTQDPARTTPAKNLTKIPKVG